jgi:hypothetical protein
MVVRTGAVGHIRLCLRPVRSLLQQLLTMVVGTQVAMHSAFVRRRLFLLLSSHLTVPVR